MKRFGWVTVAVTISLVLSIFPSAALASSGNLTNAGFETGSLSGPTTNTVVDSAGGVAGGSSTTVLDGSGVVAYEVPAGTEGWQAHSFAFGMDFDVAQPITVSHLGVFDSGSDGLKLPLNARLYDRDTRSVVAGLDFATGDTGLLIGGSRFLALATPVNLPAGFHGTIVAEGYGAAELAGNCGGAVSPWTTNSGGDAIAFVGGGRYALSAGAFPENVDGGPASRYAAGTFLFDVQESVVVSTPPAIVGDSSTIYEGSGAVAYSVPAAKKGWQDFNFALGMDFDVKKAVKVSHLGVFDSGSDGLKSPLNARLYDRDTRSVVASLDFATGNTGRLIGGSRFLALATPVNLPEGFQGTVVAEGYGAAELAGNSGGAVPSWTTNSKGDAIAFVGGGRFGRAARAFPEVVDGGPSSRYAAGTFLFDVQESVVVSTPPAIIDDSSTVYDGDGVVAYEVPAGTEGWQDHNLALGMDFDVTQAITVSHLGVFDSGSDGLKLPLNTRLYDRDTRSVVASLDFATGDTGQLIGGSRFLALATPVNLPPGFHGTIASEGYGPTELAGNAGGAVPSWTTNSGGGAIAFVGDGRYALSAGAFPENLDGGPANRYATGTFMFYTHRSVILTATPPTIDENGSATLSGTVIDPGALDANTVVITWGDGSPNTSLDLAAGVLTFTATHQYLDNKVGDAAYSIEVAATDREGAGATGSATVVVKNVAPTVEAGADAALFSSQTYQLNASFTDPGMSDTHTITIDWGDGSPLETGVVTESAGSGVVTASHTYFLFGNHPAKVIVTDKDGGIGSDTLTVAVKRLVVQMDIKPGSFTNSINLKSKGNVPVGVFSGTYGGVTVDATAIDRSSLVLAGAPDLGIGKSPEDLNGDGKADMVFHFDTTKLNLNAGSTQAVLTGKTTGNIYFEAVDIVSIVPKQ